MKIVIDGDGCPVKEIAENTAKRMGIGIVIYISIKHYSPKSSDNMIYVDAGFQSVDMAVANNISKGDVVVTGDYGLAELCLMKGCFCISFTGMIIDNRNIDELLSIRFIGNKIRQSGGRTKGPQKRKPEDDQRFEKNLEKIIGRALYGI